MKKALQTIFSLKRSCNHKILTILGIKIKFKSKRKVTIKKIYDLLVATNKQVENINFKQNLIMDYFLDIKDAKKATGSLRDLQLKSLDVLKEFIRICEQNNLNYWVDAGTLLGSVRHQGFVPWDDDLDVSLTKDDYQKFKKIVEKELSENFYFSDDWPGLSRIKSKNSNEVLDIFMYDVKGDFMRIHQLDDNFERDFEPIPYNIVFPTIDLFFENIKVKAPCKYDLFLRCRYGAYNKLPKKKHVYSHAVLNEYIEFMNKEDF